jgi:hypothetical protein
MAHVPEIETVIVRRITLMGSADSIEDARAVVITVWKAMGGHEITQDLKEGVSEWLNCMLNLTGQDHNDLLALIYPSEFPTFTLPECETAQSDLRSRMLNNPAMKFRANPVHDFSRPSLSAASLL